MIGWAAASAILFSRLVVSFVGGWRLARSAREVDEIAVRAWVEAAAERLGLRAVPKVRRLAAVSCPAVWCWGRRPILLLPEDRANSTAIDWVGVFRHELAHWARRDHISALLSEILVCALPWQPLAWWSRGRLGQLAELACDDWALAGGISPADYAESLLALRPQGRSTPALAAVSHRRGLMKRLQHILAEGRREPAVGARWTLAVCLVLCAAVSVLALAQARPTKARADDAPKADSPKTEQAAMKTLRGKVLAPDGKPLAGASVVWMGNRKPPLPYDALPRGSRETSPMIETIAQTRTNDDGTFELSAPFVADDYQLYNGVNVHLMVTAPGFGLLAENFAAGDLDKEVTLQVPEQVVIHGRLLAPNGMPAAGVRATFSGFFNDMTGKGMSVWMPGMTSELPPAWPRPQETDADGRFTIEGVPVGTYATIVFEHPDYAVDEVTVNTIPERTISAGLRGFEIVPVEPTFTYSLEPARPVAGRVTDKETGEPLAGMLVQMIPMRRHGGQTFTTRTDADGRYRVAGHSTDGTYFITVYPDADSGYLGANETRDGWPAGANVLTVDFALEKGRLIHGRVADQDGDLPVAGAAVVYQPGRGNPNDTGGRDLRNTVITDADGRFTITALPGAGFVAVETPSDAYIRSPMNRPGYTERAHPQGFASIDVPKEGEPEPVEIAVRKGVPLEARVVDPDGKPVESVTAMYIGIDAALIDVWNSGREFRHGEFRIPGADPERTYRVFFLNVDRRLGAVAELKRDPAGKPLEVRLEPTATIRGKLAMPGGDPPPEGSQIYVRMLVKPERKEYSRDDLYNQNDVQFYSNVLGQRNFHHHEGQPRAGGEFELDVMIPGVGYYVTGYAAGREISTPVWDLKPGEVRDLGTVTLKEEER